jgi:hypothetical protein
VINVTNRNIRKYIAHSQSRLQERQAFHTKNIEELSKYLQFNMNFTVKRKWEDVEKGIGLLFLKKKANAETSIEKVFKIVMEHAFIKNLFVDFSSNEESNINIEDEDAVKI